MTADQEKQLEAMFSAGDPAARLPEYLPQRVAARLDARRAPRLGWARWAVVGITLVSSAGLGAAAVWVSNEVRKSSAPVEPAAAARVVPAPVIKRAPDPLAEEAALVQASLEAVQRGDAETALSKLDERERRFPAGLLGSEAAVARIKALLVAHREDEALERFAALDSADVTGPLRLTWADVLVKRGRCAEAATVLAPLEDSEVARSLKGSCVSRPQRSK